MTRSKGKVPDFYLTAKKVRHYGSYNIHTIRRWYGYIPRGPADLFALVDFVRTSGGALAVAFTRALLTS